MSVRHGRASGAINLLLRRVSGTAVLAVCRTGALAVSCKAAVVLCLLCLALAPITTAHGAARAKPYDAKVQRLSEILGAVHYLRELCGSNEGQLWREHMQALLKAEGTTALRRASLTRSFNKGYRSYSRTYNECTPSAKTAIQRFIVEGVEIAEGLAKK